MGIKMLALCIRVLESSNSTESWIRTDVLTHSLTRTYNMHGCCLVCQKCVTAFHLVYDCFDLFFSNHFQMQPFAIFGHSRIPINWSGLLMNLLQGFNALQNGFNKSKSRNLLDFDVRFSKTINLMPDLIIILAESFVLPAKPINRKISKCMKIAKLLWFVLGIDRKRFYFFFLFF